ncbi:KRAB-A domain-containing protein 2-like [Macrosteles quadrilineatus]|uniref:KRAB-A domain-containing protein 2-like n=1 Tax=Macrosteles quadrilineatus TaxID=74068 RepID=UPI0023E29339|nr:KRAB-A domain-containing protein 2-like [Macrosteles quadrilineatus]
MKDSFNTKPEELMSKKDGLTSRNFLIEEQRYEEIIGEVKEAKDKRRNGQSLSSKDYRRINRFDVINIGDKEMLIEKTTGEMTDIKYFCRIDQMYDTIHSAHLCVGHKKEKAMEVELKKKFCNITREVIKIYLDMCEPCSLKKKSQSKGLVVKPIITTALNSRCQVDLIDMQSEPDGEYKFILNYQDHLTKFVVLRPLKTKTADEVSDVLLDIFCLFGAPYILHSDNGREFCNRVIENLARKWSAIKLVHGKPRHSQSQGSVERANQDVRDSLVAWMADNNTSGWANGLKIIQNTKNNS